MKKLLSTCNKTNFYKKKSGAKCSAFYYFNLLILNYQPQKLSRVFDVCLCCCKPCDRYAEG